MDNKDYDYIIVGAGAAGCTIAREILRRRLGTVLLVEAGGAPRSPSLRVPAEYLSAFGSRWDWNHCTAPQSGLARRRVKLPAGRALGGSTVINAMVAIEAPDRDFDGWKASLGDSWSCAQVREAYDQVHAWLNNVATRFDAGCELPSLPRLHPRMQTILERASTSKWLSHSSPSGFDKPRLGIDSYRRMQHAGRRVSVWDLIAHDVPATRSTTPRAISILNDQSVHRIAFDGERAVGIELLGKSREMILVKAQRGVIVSAGAIETPRLLMASGMGPRDLLTWSGIECRVELPELGENLQDHLVFPVVMRSLSEFVDVETQQRLDRIEYLCHRTGNRSSNLAELGGFFNCDAPTFDVLDHKATPEFQWHITPTHYLEYPPFASRHPCTSFAITPLRPLSRGSLRPEFARCDWNVNGPMPLTIDPRYLTHENDIEQLLHAIAWTRNAIAASPWGDSLGDEVFPRERASDPQRAENYVRRYASTIYHYASTCGMGAHSTSCLDDHFRVRGINQLWVCDASAMPHLVSCNPQLTVMMMAVRLAGWLCD